jgi:glycosyltransferase involved in cell wall biosynthesis
LVAVVSPLPPAPTGVADFSYRMLAALREHCDLHAFADGLRHVDDALGPPRVPDGVEIGAARYLGEHERAQGGYDCVVYCVGNSEFHGYALAQLRRRSGVVLAHEVRLPDLHAFAGDIPGAVPDDADGTQLSVAAELVALSDRFVVMSRYAADRVRLDLDSELAARVAVVPFAGREVVEGATPSDERAPIVASFGIVNAIKQNALTVAAFPMIRERITDATLVFVGPCADAEREFLTKLAAELGVADGVTITGGVPEPEYEAWLDRADRRRAAPAVRQRRELRDGRRLHRGRRGTCR